MNAYWKALLEEMKEGLRADIAAILEDRPPPIPVRLRAATRRKQAQGRLGATLKRLMLGYTGRPDRRPA